MQILISLLADTLCLQDAKPRFTTQKYQPNPKFKSPTEQIRKRHVLIIQMLHYRLRLLFRMCAIIAASHLHHSRFLLSTRLRSHSDRITPINTHSIRIVFEDINVDAKVKRATEWACSNFLLNWSHLPL